MEIPRPPKPLLAHGEIDREKVTLLLPLPREAFLSDAARAAIAELGLLEKKSLHLTIVGFDTGTRLKEIAPDAADRLEALVGESGAWSVTPLPKFFYIEKNEELDGQPYRRQSLIQECSVPEMENFYTEISARFGETFAVPYPHVTLGSNSNVPGRELRGIGIYSMEDLEKLDVRREISIG